MQLRAFSSMACEMLVTVAEEWMKYLFAWMLGVPGVLILLWFAISHL